MIPSNLKSLFLTLCFESSAGGHTRLAALSLQWRHNERYGVPDHQARDCLLNRWFKAQIKENIKALRHWPLCGEFTSHRWIPAQRASNAENVSIWWRHHDGYPDESGFKLQFISTYPVLLTHWGRATHLCASKLPTIGSDNGLSPGRRLAIIWTNARILLIRTLGTNVSESLSEIHTFSFSKMRLKVSSGKLRLFRLGLNELEKKKRSPDS